VTGLLVPAAIGGLAGALIGGTVWDVATWLRGRRRTAPMNRLTCLTVDPDSWRLLSEYDKATLRWAKTNRQRREAGCPCGRDATEVRHDHDNNGDVPVETWTCWEHVNAAAWSGTKPFYARTSPCATCEDLCSRGGRIGQPFDTWYCQEAP
jgi:hypothetical protein